MGRYDPLRDYLVQCGSDEITLSFTDIESIIGRPLPPSALKYDAWWANIGDSVFNQHSHAKSWHAAGYKAQVNRAGKTVRFCRETVISDAPVAIPFIDWNGSGRIDPVDIGISMAATELQDEPDVYDGERIALISCSKLKKPYRCRASELYSASTLFSLSYEYAKANADRVYIISAKHGLVGEDEVIEPYDETLNEKTSSERQAWSQMVLNQLKQVCDIQRTEFIVLAGKYYYEYLLPYLPHVSLPLGKLPLGKRIEFLQRNLAYPEGAITRQTSAADQLHKMFSRLPVYTWRTIDDIPFQDGIYIVFEKGENYKGHARIVRVGTHTSQGRLKQRLKDHFVRENHNGSIFRKNIGKAMLNREHDLYLPIWTLDTSKAPNIGKEDKAKEEEVEHRVSAYMQEAFTFCVFKVDTKEERLRFEEAIIATLNQTDDFKASANWLGNSSPEWEIRQSGMWLKQGLDAEPLTDNELFRLTRRVSSEKPRQIKREEVIPPRESPLDLKAGDRVHHSIFGDGTVLSVRSIAVDDIAEIEFDSVGRKNLALRIDLKCMMKIES